MNYLIWCLVSVFIVIALTFFSIKYKFSKRTALFIMVGVSIASELTKVFSHVNAVYNEAEEFLGYYITPAALPLHLCSILIFIFFFLALSKNEKINDILYNFFVPIGIIGGVCGIFFATSGTSFTEPSPYQSFIYHSTIVWFALYLIITKQVHLGWKVLIRNLIIMFSLSIVMIWINGALRINAVVTNNSINFFFLTNPPKEGLPFLNFNHGWFVYYIHLIMTGIILMSAISAPYMISDIKKEKA